MNNSRKPDANRIISAIIPGIVMIFMGIMLIVLGFTVFNQEAAPAAMKIFPIGMGILLLVMSLLIIIRGILPPKAPQPINYQNGDIGTVIDQRNSFDANDRIAALEYKVKQLEKEVDELKNNRY